MFLSHHRLRRAMLRLVDHVGLARMYIDCLVCLACFVWASEMFVGQGTDGEMYLDWRQRDGEVRYYYLVRYSRPVASCWAAESDKRRRAGA